MMSRSFCALLLLALALTGLEDLQAGEVVTTFENFPLPSAPSNFDQNAGPSGLFTIDGNSYNNSYNSTYDAWSGWAISSTTDTTTPGFTNQYSSITGSGAGDSTTYAVAYTFGDTANPTHPASSDINLAPGVSPLSVDITNTTYAYLSMEYGDQFAKKFGPGDYFLLDIKGYTGLNGTGQVVGDVDFYLANFLGSKSYIIDTWNTLDLSSLAGSKSLQFGLQSSDNGDFGINTPAYFSLDAFTIQTSTAAIPEPSSVILSLAGLGIVGMSAWRRRWQATPAS